MLVCLLGGCKAKERVISQERIERQQVDTIRVPGEQAVLTGTLAYIPERGIVISGIEQKNTPGIHTSVSIHGDTLRVTAQVEEKELEVVKQEITETTIVQKEDKPWYRQFYRSFCYILILIAIILLLLFLLKRR